MHRGKGDYHRLGHGSDDHVRRPKKVAALQGKRIICIAVGESMDGPEVDGEVEDRGREQVLI